MRNDEDDEAPFKTPMEEVLPLLAPGADRSLLFSKKMVNRLAGIKLKTPEDFEKIRIKLAGWTPHFAKLESAVDKFLGEAKVTHKRQAAETTLKDALLEAKGRGSAIIADGEPVTIARTFIEAKMPTLVYVDEEWLRYTGTRYESLPMLGVRADLSRWLDSGTSMATGAGYITSKRDKDDIMDSVRDEVYRDAKRYKPPAWLDSDGTEPLARDIIALANGLLDVRSGELFPHSPNFFSRIALEHRFTQPEDCDMPEQWLKFLKSVWPDDQEQIDALQEWMGYILTADTSLQRILSIIGPTRSGKGTIIRVVGHLLGARNVMETSLNVLGTNFGLAGLIGKSLLVIPDARLGKKADANAIAEVLLNISGGDDMTIDRKFKEQWMGRLNARVIIASNMEIGFPDTSGAINRRLYHLVMTESFLGREDWTLDKKLDAELPGILNWSLAGLRRLEARVDEHGRRVGFVDTHAGKAVAAQIARHSSPVMAFMREVCDIGPGHSTVRGKLFQAYSGWMRASGVKPWQSLDEFVKQVHTVNRTVECLHTPGTDANVWRFTNIGLKPEYLYTKWPSEASMELTEEEEEGDY